MQYMSPTLTVGPLQAAPYPRRDRLACLKMAAPYWQNSELLSGFLAMLDKYKV